MRLLFAIGAVVVGEPTTFQTPLSGQISPVFAIVPIGLVICLASFGRNADFKLPSTKRMLS
jgi:hypothetical protein